MSITIENAIIQKVDLGCEDLCLTLDITIKAQKGSVVFGGIALDDKAHKAWRKGKKRAPTRLCNAVLQSLFEVTESSTLSSVKGKPIRVKWEGSLCKAIGHFLEDKWLSYEDIYKEVENFESEI